MEQKKEPKNRFLINKNEALVLMRQSEIALIGLVLRYFSSIEKIIDDINRRDSYPSIKEYDDNIEMFKINGNAINIDVKLNLFFKALDRFDEKFGGEIQIYFNTPAQRKFVRKDLEDLVEIRNQMAHWPTDMSDDGIQYYFDHNELLFVKIEKDAVITKNGFTSDKAAHTEIALNGLIAVLMFVQREIRRLQNA